VTLNTSNISKTSLNGAIAFFIAAVPLATVYPGLHIPATLMAWLSFAAGLGRLWVGLTQVDSGTVPAVLPGNPTPVLVPSHEVPDNPTAKVVTPVTAPPKL
jgi:hypothetical protein